MANRLLFSEKLRGARVLVIGGSSGIGFGLANALLELSASVIISSSSSQRIAGAVKRLQERHPSIPDRSVEGVPSNLGELDALSDEIGVLFAKATKEGRLDHVVFTAGDTLPVKELEDFSLRDIQRAGTVRFFAPLVVAQHLRQNLNDGPASSYTVTTGGVPQHLMKDWAVAQAYLGGLNSMARGLAVDLAPIRVNAVGLGVVDTELWDAAKEAGAYEQVRGRFEAKMTTGRIGKVEDVVEAYLYLMKDHNASGTTVNSNGGTLLL